MLREENETIVGLATSPGAAGIAVIRMSGDRALEIGQKLVPALKENVEEKKLKLCRIIRPENKELLDVALVCYMKAPRSYSGQDVVEFQTHGGIATVNSILETLIDSGARTASPGEFTLRAFLNGRIDLSEAEAIAALINAKSEQARRIAIRQLKGGLGKSIREIRKRIIGVLAEIEARLDLVEEEVRQPGRRGS